LGLIRNFDKIKPFIFYLKKWSICIPEVQAIVIPGRNPITYKELYPKIQTVQSAFRNAGITQGSLVAIFLRDPYEMAIAHLAIASGSICIPLPQEPTPDEAFRLLSNSGAQYIITDTNFPESLRLIVNDLSIREIMFSSLNIYPDKDPPQQDFSIKDIAYILQTTGSTSQPKLVPITHEAISFSCLGTKHSLEISHQDRCLNFLTLTNIQGLISSFLMPLISGSCCILTGFYDKRAFNDWLADLKPTWFSAPPAIYQNIIQNIPSKSIKQKTQSLRFIRSGAAAMNIKLASELEEFFSVPLIESYGMTETIHLTGNPVSHRRLGSVGKQVASEIAIFNVKNKRCKPFETGSIRVRGRSIVGSYLNDQEATKTSFKNGWFCTGDQGWFDDENYLYLTGREKEIINKGGEKISPFEVENILLRYPGIREAVVFGIPHPSLGEEVAAAIVVNVNMVVIEAEIKDFLRELLTFSKVPVRILEVAKLPKSESGKVIRRNLAQSLLDQISNHENNSDYKVRTPVENFVGQWFSIVLNQPVINVDDDFFSLGGTSLDAAELISSISKVLNGPLNILALIKAPTVRKFAQFLTNHYPDLLKIVLIKQSTEHKQENISSFFLKEVAFDSQDFINCVLEPQKKFIASWKGIRRRPDSLIMGKNISGTKLPLFWCFQGYEELEALAGQLGKDQPVYGMRSGNLLIKNNPDYVKELAKYYTNEIAEILDHGECILGGNCQGAGVAWEIGCELSKKELNVKLLCLMEINILKHWPGKIALFYGSRSHRNPFRTETAPEKNWNSCYLSYTIDIINGQHGTFFKGPNLLDFSKKLINRLEEANV